jgi:hypothetical protein
MQASRCQWGGAKMTDVSTLVSLVPNTAAILVFALILVFWLLIFYALRNKGDVRAEFSHGSTMFRLEAKGRSPARNRRRE